VAVGAVNLPKTSGPVRRDRPLCRVQPKTGRGAKAHILQRLGPLHEGGAALRRFAANSFGVEFWELLYPWHPWSGLRIGIHEAIERPGGVVFRCDLTASDANRWLEIPAWMFDRSASAKMGMAVEPHTDLSALVMLGALLRDVRNKSSTARNAADSSVSLSLKN
jgi:hypothetical protein